MSSKVYNEEGGGRRIAFYDRGPGPAGFMLPPLIGRRLHALTHRINPEYSFGLKCDTAFFVKNVGPGAGAILIPKGLKSNGKFLGYAYTIRLKFPPREQKH
jgi:hypothetical protein